MASAGRTITVPEGISMEAVQHYLTQLQVTEDTLANSSHYSSETESEPEDIEVEITGCRDHRVEQDGSFSFLLCGRGLAPGGEWFADSACNCEYILAKYLHSKNLRTLYGYCRVSSLKQDNPDAVSLDAQEAALRQEAAQGAFHRIKIYKIKASAYRGIPRDLQDIADSAQSGSAILIFRVDRLSRNINLYLSLLDELDQRGVNIGSCHDGITYRTHKLDFMQLILNGQRESQTNGDKQRMANQYKRERGDEHIGGTRYGIKYYRKPDGSKGLCENPEEMQILQYVQSHTIEQTYKHFKHHSILKRGRPWSRDMIKRAVTL